MTNYNLEYLNALIENKVEENLNLDYKAAKALDKQNNKTTEISKDVSALANSDGGVLIYGIKESQIDKHLPEKIDPIIRKDFTKEWLEQIIQDKIRPRLSDFKIHPIEINSKQVVYIVEVEKSTTAHQAFDKKYYKRYNFQSTAMYDYEIRDILNRAKNPEIELDFKFDDRHRTLIVDAVNVGNILAKFLIVDFKIPKHIVKGNEYSPFNKISFETYNLDNTTRDIVGIQSIGLNDLSNQYGPSRYEPILPNRRFRLTEIGLDNHPFDEENYLEWEIFCDNANPRKGTVKMRELLNRK